MGFTLRTDSALMFIFYENIFIYGNLILPKPGKDQAIYSDRIWKIKNKNRTFAGLLCYK